MMVNILKLRWDTTLMGHNVEVFNNPEQFNISKEELDTTYDPTNNYKLLAISKGNVAIRIATPKVNYRENEIAIYGTKQAIKQLWNVIYQISKQNNIKRYTVNINGNFEDLFITIEEFIEKYS